MYVCSDSWTGCHGEIEVADQVCVCSDSWTGCHGEIEVADQVYVCSHSRTGCHGEIEVADQVYVCLCIQRWAQQVFDPVIDPKANQTVTGL